MTLESPWRGQYADLRGGAVIGGSSIAFILNAAEPLVRAEFHADRSTHHSNLQTLDKEF
ncbi:hypothetical protein [Leptolyngbya sp. CCY15150]|uniref:hypothetical protein n=1 Tax=Leptolyngbya sp. CCY15150 TaxID=2767772 RepID=UPI0019501ADC|nr:hypothetical protein [Leptolyngbya sp. CCY15150]